MGEINLGFPLRSGGIVPFVGTDNRKVILLDSAKRWVRPSACAMSRTPLHSQLMSVNSVMT